MARKTFKWYGTQQRFGNTRRKRAPARRRNNVGRSVDLGLEQLEPRWVLASPGSLDITFDLDGLVAGEFGITADVRMNAMAVQNDGKIVVAGTIATALDPTEDIVVARFNTDGSLDTTFGDNDSIGGYTTFNFATVAFAGQQSFAYDVAIDSSGNIIVVGQGRASLATLNGFAIAELGSDGELVAGFGTGGKVITTFAAGASAEARGVALQSDGKIVVAGTELKSSATPTRNDFAVARYNMDGTLDTSFDIDGKLVTDFNGRNDNAWDVVIQTVGAFEKILVVGDADRTGSAVNDFAMARYNPDGSLDTVGDAFDVVEFGVAGKLTSVVGAGAIAAQNSAIASVALDSAGRIIVGGTVGDLTASTDMIIARYNASGLLDSATFNPLPVGVTIAGTRRVDFALMDTAFGLVVQPDGQYIIAGETRTGTATPSSSFRFALARINGLDGSLDSSFGTGGLVQTPAFPDGGGPDPPFEPAEPDFVRLAAIALQPDGKLVAAGWQDLETTDPDYLLARYETGLVVSSISGPASINEADTYTLTLSSGDPTTSQWTINWGDGTQIVAGNPTSVTHVYADGLNNYTISATVTISTGTFAVGNTVAVGVLNVAPTLAIGGASSENEGSLYTLSLSSSDPGADTISSWTIDWGDSIEVVSGNPASATHTYVDGVTNYTISATATDEDGTYAAGNTVAVTVQNVAPTLAIGGASSENEGSLYTLSLSSSDPGADTISSWTIDWGDSIEVVSGNPASATHVYADGNVGSNYTITATATDEDGTHAAGNTVSVTVVNLPPTADAGGPYQTFDDTPITLTGTGADPAEAADPLTYLWDLDGDNMFGETGAGATRGDEVGANVTYDPTGLGTSTQTVALQVSDGDGGVTVATSTVQVLGQGTLVIGGVLYIVGSNTANDIVIITKCSDTIFVIATFNSSNPLTFSESSITDIQVRTRGGSDIVVTTSNVTKTMTIDGGSGNDMLTGGGGRNLILGGTGHDILYGAGGDDVLLGGTGNDDLFGGSGNDVLVGGDGNDILYGGSGRDVLIGSQNDDRLYGGTDEDVLIGGVTIHDNNVAALDAVMAIWGSAASFSARVATLTSVGGLLEAGVAVFDDDDHDVLVGGAGRDLYFGDNNLSDGVVDTILLQAMQDQLIAVT